MDKRIKLVFLLSIITMTLTLAGQAYWLYNQYLYTSNAMADELKNICAKGLATEEEMRIKEVYEYLGEQKIKDTLNVTTTISYDYSSKRKPTSTSTFTYLLPEKGKVVFNCNGLTSSAAGEIYNKYKAASFKSFQTKVIDSLLTAKGSQKIQDFKHVKMKANNLEPRFSTEIGWETKLKVAYWSNPLFGEGIAFSIPIPVSNVIKSMMWQLIASTLLLIVLTICTLYQIKTIIIQKRIDGIRREFMKNMIFEMKQPEETGADGECLHIGDTEFRYGLNELQYREERVILTSRQAEILKLLSDSPNRIVPREDILLAAWGDDSYSNSLALNVQITHLRRALKSDEKLSIDVIYKKGYILNIRNQ